MSNKYFTVIFYSRVGLLINLTFMITQHAVEYNDENRLPTLVEIYCKFEF